MAPRVTRTLLISDLHLGGRLFHGVLAHREPLERLLAALDTIDRLVLLGDVIELLERRPQRAMELARPVLSALGRRMGPEREIVYVPGNHDLALIRPWVRARGAALGVADEVPCDATTGLASICRWLAPAQVRVGYPGVWLEHGVWATHGHYLDQHLLPVSTYGIARASLGGMPRDGAAPVDYERGRRRSIAPATRLMPRPGALLIDELAEVLRAATMPRLKRRLLRPRYARLISGLLRVQMNRASMPALARVVNRLGIDADWVVFGHVHRVGPLPGDDRSLWQGPGGRPRLVNTGAWLYEPLLVNRARPPHPHWPGGAVLLDDGPDGGEPRALSLLDDLGARQLH